MQFDDDVSERPLRKIRSSSRIFKRVPNVSAKTVELVIGIANKHPNWGPKRILAEARRTRKDITIDEVRTILS